MFSGITGQGRAESDQASLLPFRPFAQHAVVRLTEERAGVLRCTGTELLRRLVWNGASKGRGS